MQHACSHPSRCGGSQWEQGSVKGMGVGKFSAEEPEKMLSHPPCLFVLTAPGCPRMIM